MRGYTSVSCTAWNDPARVNSPKTAAGARVALAHTGEARIRNDGTRDATFAVGVGVTSTVRALLATRAGEVYVGGSFTTCNGAISNRLARLSDLGGSL